MKEYHIFSYYLDWTLHVRDKACDQTTNNFAMPFEVGLVMDFDIDDEIIHKGCGPLTAGPEELVSEGHQQRKNKGPTFPNYCLSRVTWV